MATTQFPSITEFKGMDDTNKSLLIWQGISDIWNKLMVLIDNQKTIESDIRTHDKILITGNGEDPSLLERVRNLEKFQSNFLYWARFLGGALILNFIGFSAGIIIAVVKFLPVLERLASP